MAFKDGLGKKRNLSRIASKTHGTIGFSYPHGYEIDAKDLHYKELNYRVKKLYKGIKFDGLVNGDSNKTINNHKSDKVCIILRNVLGQRYIGDGIKAKIMIKIDGIPGNDLGAFMDGPEIEVYGNGQDGVGNTMNSGKIIIHGDAGDIVGHSMRGGEIYIEGNIGYRGGIHMKSYLEKAPVIVVGGRTGNFLGEYMAGGIIIILGLASKQILESYSHFINSRSIVGSHIGTGMHGGRIYIRGKVGEYKLGKEVKKMKLDEDDKKLLYKYINNFCSYFNKNCKEILDDKILKDNFIKLIPATHRPYGKLYAY